MAGSFPSIMHTQYASQQSVSARQMISISCWREMVGFCHAWKHF